MRRLAVLILAACLLAPAAAHGATATVTGDDGAAVPLGGAVTIRNMKPVVAFSFAAEERRHFAVVTGPDGQPAGPPASCAPTENAPAIPVEYRGNGTYTVTVATSPDAGDVACEQDTAQTFTFEVSASAPVLLPDAQFTRYLLRRPGETAFLTYEFPVDVNPGSDATDVELAPGGALEADGSLVGGTEVPFEPLTGNAEVTFSAAGSYALSGRPALEGVFGAWSPPLAVQVLAPFDFRGNPRFRDRIGPRYRITGRVREASARGAKIAVRIARGKSGGRFRRLKSIRVRAGGRFSLRFKLNRTRGAYRLRYVFAGNATVLGGTVEQRITIRRTRR